METLLPPNLLKELLLESQEEDIPPLNPRAIDIPLNSRKPVILTGMRRTGKSSLLQVIQQKLITDHSIARDQICYINFFDERLRPLKKEILSAFENAYWEVRSTDSKQLTYWFLDEIQLVPEWEYFVDRIARKQKNRVFVTGSSAELASGEIASALRGRPLVYELFPYSLNEMYKIRDLPIDRISQRTKPKIQKIFDDYLTSGGFPETIDMEPSLRRRIHTEYYRTVFARDIIEKHNPQDSYVVEVVLKEFTNQVALFTSLNRIRKRLASIGIRVSGERLGEYLSWAEQAYFLYRVPLFTESEQKRRVNPIKLYAIDSGLIASVSGALSDNFGRLLENLVFIHLRTITTEIFYYRTHQDYEVDFVIPQGRNESLIQVCYDISDPDTRYREIRALEEGMKELRVKKGWLITARHEEIYRSENSEIEIIPAWRFLTEVLTSEFHPQL